MAAWPLSVGSRYNNTHNNDKSKGEQVAGKAGRAYWNANLRIVAILLSIWAFVSFGLAIFFVDALDQVRLGGFKLGFWLAQQGAIYVYLLLILAYILLMDRLDRRHGVAEPPQSVEAAPLQEQARAEDGQ